MYILHIKKGLKHKESRPKLNMHDMKECFSPKPREIHDGNFKFKLSLKMKI